MVSSIRLWGGWAAEVASAVDEGWVIGASEVRTEGVGGVEGDSGDSAGGGVSINVTDPVLAGEEPGSVPGSSGSGGEVRFLPRRRPRIIVSSVLQASRHSYSPAGTPRSSISDEMFHVKPRHPPSFHALRRVESAYGGVSSPSVFVTEGVGPGNTDRPNHPPESSLGSPQRAAGATGWISVGAGVDGRAAPPGDVSRGTVVRSTGGHLPALSFGQIGPRDRGFSERVGT